jgi:hypothetical protein
VCKDCGRPFARQDALARHGKLHSRGESAKYASPSSVTPIEQEPEIAPPSSSSTWDCSSQAQQSTAVASSTAELDFALIWPDSEELFHSIMASEAVEQGQVPLGTLPFLPVVDQITNLGSPSSFADRGASVGTIPSGKGHQAVRDVTEMVTSLVRG